MLVLNAGVVQGVWLFLGVVKMLQCRTSTESHSGGGGWGFQTHFVPFLKVVLK